jgi:hypothetical protein
MQCACRLFYNALPVSIYDVLELAAVVALRCEAVSRLRMIALPAHPSSVDLLDLTRGRNPGDAGR